MDLARTGMRQKGQVLVILVLSRTMLLGIVGLSIDLGFKFLLQREAQNAADAAALAGARALNGWYQYGALGCPSGSGCTGLVNWTGALIQTEITNAAAANVKNSAGRYPTWPNDPSTTGLSWPSGTGNSLVAYYLITNGQSPPTITQGDAVSNADIPANAVGIRVEATLGHDSMFAQLLGSCCTRDYGFAKSRAMIQAASGNGFKLPFLLCAIGANSGLLITNADGTYSVNYADHQNQTYFLQGAQFSNDCNAGNSSWKGFADASLDCVSNNVVPCTETYITGNSPTNFEISNMPSGFCDHTQPTVACTGVVGMAISCAGNSTRTCNNVAWALMTISPTPSQAPCNQGNGNTNCWDAKLQGPGQPCQFSTCSVTGAFKPGSTGLTTLQLVPDE